MNRIDEQLERAGTDLRAAADRRAQTLGDATAVVAAARRRNRLQTTTVVALLVAAVVTVGSLMSSAGLVIAPVAREVSVWTGATVELPDGWQVAPQTLMPNGPTEQFVASTGDLPVGGDRCAQVPEAALEALGPTDGLVVVQQLHSAGPDDPVLGTLERWPAEHRNRTSFRACLDDGDRLELFWFHTRLDGRGYWVLAAFGLDATDQRRDEALAIVNSLRPAPTGGAQDPDGQAADEQTAAEARRREQHAAAAAAEREARDPTDHATAERSEPAVRWWQQTLGGGGVSSHGHWAVANHDTVFAVAGVSAEELVAVDLTTGEERWRTPIGGRWSGLPQLATDDLMLVSAQYETVQALDTATGGTVWQLDLDDGYGATTAALVGDGSVLLVANSHQAGVRQHRRSSRHRWPSTPG